MNHQLAVLPTYEMEAKKTRIKLVMQNILLEKINQRYFHEFFTSSSGLFNKNNNIK